MHSHEIPELEQIPQKIRVESSNLEVHLFLFNQLLKYDYNLTQHRAWTMVKRIKGDGEGVFVLTKERWVTAFGDTQGTMLFHKIERERKNSEKDTLTDVSNFKASLELRCLVF